MDERAVKPAARIEQWMLLHGRLFGNVYGHPGIPDGTYVSTSPVRNLHRTKPLAEGATVETNNTLYQLGLPCGRTT